MTFRSSSNPKTAVIEIRVTPEEKEQIQSRAADRLMTVSKFALNRMLGKQAPLQYEYIAINTLSELDRDIKALYRQRGCRPEDAEQLQPLRDAIVEAIGQLWKQRGRV